MNNPKSKQTKSISRTFFDNASKYPDKPAIIFDNFIISYKELSCLVARLSYAMLLKGVKKGDHIGILLPNCIEFVVVMLVAADIGAVIVPLSSSLPAQAVHHGLKASDVKHVVGKANILNSLLASDHDFLFVSGLWLSVDKNVKGAVSWDELLKGNPQDTKPCFIGKENDPYILLTTSGSTGTPKPIILTQKTKWNRAFAAIELYNVTLEDRTLAATPLYHSLAERLVLIPLLTGGTSVIMPKFSASEWFRYVSENKVTFTLAVSSQLRQISEQLSIENDSSLILDSMRCIVSSSALLEPRIKADLLSKLKCDFHECYGASEIAIATNLNSDDAKKKLKSVGNAAPGVDVKIFDKKGNSVPVGETGEIVCKTPMRFSGYYKLPKMTKKAMWGEYFRTGDIGKIDNDGFLYFLGREKEIIISGGINVYPSDIEAVLVEHETVLENAAFPINDDRLGEVVAVAIVPKDRNSFNLRSIKHYCAEKLADFQMPRKYFIIDELPKNNMGKIMKHALVKKYCDIMNKKDQEL